MIKLGIDPNKDYTAELITMGTVLLKEMNENRQKRWEQEEKEAERLEKMKAENTATNTKKYVEYYKLNYVDKYFTAAKNGDEEARLILMMKANELREECSYEKNSNYCDENEFLKVIPENENIPENLRSEWNWLVDWLYDLCDSNNVDGLNLRGNLISKESLETYLPDLEKAVSLGSLDAMVILGMYYNENEKLEGGNNEEKALFWFTKAANSGCPMAAYYLGMIYKYGHTIRPENYSKKTSLYLTYSVKKDDKIAAEWFAKSIAFSKNHKESTFAKHTLILNRISWTSIFDFEMAYYGLGISISHPDAFIQLSKIYFKGQGVEKNETLAKQLEQEGNTLYKFYRDLK
jgi:TPR repeat protein